MTYHDDYDPELHGDPDLHGDDQAAPAAQRALAIVLVLVFSAAIIGAGLLLQALLRLVYP